MTKGQGSGASPALAAANTAYDEFRATFRRLERDTDGGPQAADELAALITLALTRALRESVPRNVSDIRRGRASTGTYARTRYARTREECPSDAPIGHSIGHSEGAVGGEWAWTR